MRFAPRLGNIAKQYFPEQIHSSGQLSVMNEEERDAPL